MSGADAQLRRLLALLPRLADGQEHAVSAVAEQLGVPAETVTRDLESFSNRVGDPPGWIEHVQIYLEPDRVSVHADRFRRPMRLSFSEARAVELGLSLLRAESAPDRRAGIEATLERVRQLEVPDGGRDGGRDSGRDGGRDSGRDGGRDSGRDSGRDDDVLRVAEGGTRRQLEHVPKLREALKNRRRVAVNYRKSGSDAAERRTICPFSFAVEKGVWYLVAHCDKADAIRIYRLDRIESIELLADTFEPPQDLRVDELLSQHTAFLGEPPEKLRIRYSPRVARWISEREQGTTNADGSFEVEYPLADIEWAVRHVLQYGPEAEVTGPGAVREAVIRRLEEALS